MIQPCVELLKNTDITEANVPFVSVNLKFSQETILDENSQRRINQSKYLVHNGWPRLYFGGGRWRWGKALARQHTDVRMKRSTFPHQAGVQAHFTKYINQSSLLLIVLRLVRSDVNHYKSWMAFEKSGGGWGESQLSISKHRCYYKAKETAAEVLWWHNK